MFTNNKTCNLPPLTCWRSSFCRTRSNISRRSATESSGASQCPRRPWGRNCSPRRTSKQRMQTQKKGVLAVFSARGVRWRSSVPFLLSQDQSLHQGTPTRRLDHKGTPSGVVPTKLSQDRPMAVVSPLANILCAPRGPWGDQPSLVVAKIPVGAFLALKSPKVMLWHI